MSREGRNRNLAAEKLFVCAMSEWEKVRDCFLFAEKARRKRRRRSRRRRGGRRPFL